MTAAHFRKLFFVDADLGQPNISDGTLRICVRNLGITEGHPLYRKPLQSGEYILYVPSAHLTFFGVLSSRRTMSEYIGDPRLGKFKPISEVEDGPFASHSRAVDTFNFEGVMDSPKAWVEWTIKSVSVELDVL